MKKSNKLVLFVFLITHRGWHFYNQYLSISSLGIFYKDFLRARKKSPPLPLNLKLVFCVCCCRPWVYTQPACNNVEGFGHIKRLFVESCWQMLIVLFNGSTHILNMSTDDDWVLNLKHYLVVILLTKDSTYFVKLHNQNCIRFTSCLHTSFGHTYMWFYKYLLEIWNWVIKDMF